MENPKIVRMKYVVKDQIELRLKMCKLCGQETYIEKNHSVCLDCKKKKN